MKDRLLRFIDDISRQAPSAGKDAREALLDIVKHPERHCHNLVDLVWCCTVDGNVKLFLVKAHSRNINLRPWRGHKRTVV